MIRAIYRDSLSEYRMTKLIVHAIVSKVFEENLKLVEARSVKELGRLMCREWQSESDGLLLLSYGGVG